MRYIFITLAAASLALGAYAVDRDEAYQALVDNAPEGCTPDAPPALKFATADNKLVMGLSGQVKATATYDFGHVQTDPNNFTSLLIPMAQDPGNGGDFMFSAQQSAVTLNVVALPGTKDQIGAYFTVNLLGDSYTPAIEYALLTYRGFSAGLGYTLFADTGAALPTIDYMGPCGYTGAGNAGLQYRVRFGKGFTFGAGLELPLISYTGNTATAEVNQRVPDIPVALTYSWDGGGSWIRGAALLRNLQYRDDVDGKNRDNIGWGIQLSGSAALASPLRLMWQATYGMGITSYFQDYTGEGYDMMPDPANPGRLKNVKAWGGYVGLQYNFTDNVYMCAGYSQVRDYADRYAGSATPWGEQSKYTQYAVGNLFWDINDYLSWGVEYIWGSRANFDNSQAHDTRIQTMLQFSF